MDNRIKTILAASLLFAAMVANAQPKLREDNIDEILKALTLKEKASLVVGAGLGSEPGIDLINAEPVRVPGAAGMTRSVERLGIPALVLSDGPAGVRISPTRKKDKNTYYCTAFPTGSLMACTWNTEMVEKVGQAMGNEALEYGVDVLLCPALNIMRNPLCGRNFEYYSEDPLVAGKIAAAMIRGIQSNGVGTSAKHFAANNQETNRTNNNVIIDEQVLRDIYLKGFEILVKEAQPWTIMSSYNKINGKYTQADEWLLTDVLRGEWGFEGLVMTDWTMTRNTAEQVSAGNDLMEWGMNGQVREIVRKVKNGKLDEAKLDICVRRVLELVVKSPTFHGYQYSNKPDLKAHAQVSREAATEGMVLLENNGVLPFTNKGQIALYGVASYDMIAGGTGSGNVNKPYMTNIHFGLEDAGFEIDETIAEEYEEYLSHKKNRKKGYVMTGEPAWKEMAVKAEDIRARVADNDAAVVTICRQAGEAGDRSIEDDFNLSALELALITDVCREYHAAGKKVVVVLNIGGVIETASWKNIPDAVLLAWGPGQEGGNAVVDILSGKVNPSGHLTMTFPLNYTDVPSSANFPTDVKSGFFSMVKTMSNGNKNKGRKDFDYTEYAEGRNIGYRYFGISGENVSYPFGYGKSYTTFSENALGEKTVKVTNTGSVAGKHVVMKFDEKGELVAFAKTRLLSPGESQVVELKY